MVTEVTLPEVLRSLAQPTRPVVVEVEEPNLHRAAAVRTPASKGRNVPCPKGFVSRHWCRQSPTPFKSLPAIRRRGTAASTWRGDPPPPHPVGISTNWTTYNSTLLVEK